MDHSINHASKMNMLHLLELSKDALRMRMRHCVRTAVRPCVPAHRHHRQLKRIEESEWSVSGDGTSNRKEEASRYVQYTLLIFNLRLYLLTSVVSSHPSTHAPLCIYYPLSTLPNYTLILRLYSHPPLFQALLKILVLHSSFNINMFEQVKKVWREWQASK